MNLYSETDWSHHLINGARFIDVRAPIEFIQGSIPGSVNLPILNDRERHLVGTAYREEGQAEAINLGHKLVSGNVREARVQAWRAEIEKYPNAILLCFRGGLRSQITQSWLLEQGIDRPLVPGGYKALRKFLLSVIDTRSPHLELEVVTGPTGSGKTKFLASQGRPFLDLEGIAAHRGSAFGAFERSQPTQIDFEHGLALEILKLPSDLGRVLVEDESRMIGKRSIPAPFFKKMRESPRLPIQVDFETRVENIFQDYVLDSALGRAHDVRRFDEFRAAVVAISRKLGDLRTREILGDISESEKAFTGGGGFASNREWIRKILIYYYDPLYKRSN
ncbi:MAG: tRNA 2-selenouridine(34) synthase MnmH [Cryobacterium sp.]|nr:tRNA 2-selenouridine(34) synthase MnmH [Oligoflexia bacterium]